MISFEVLNSPDLLLIGSHKYNLHHIQLGRSMKNTIPIDDESVEKEHAMLRLNPKGLIIESDFHFLLNNKKVQGTILLKEGDTIQVGETIFKIKGFDNSTILDPHEYYNFLEGLAKKDKAMIGLINSIEDEFIRQTSKDSNVLEE